LHDGSADDFAAGTTDAGAHVARTVIGEVILTPTAAAEPVGPDLPSGWSATPWLDGGTATLVDRQLVLDGARFGCDALFQSPRAVEFSATFAARPDQHAGFGFDFVHVPWVKFSTRWGRRLYARTHLLGVEDKKFPGDWLGQRHRFRIDWNVLDIVFSVDDERVAHLLVPVPGHMRALAANQRLGNTPLLLDWMRVTPYAPAGTFTSRVLDAGAPVEWLTAVWQADVPDAASLAVLVRTGDTAAPGRSWSPWRRLAGSGAPLGGDVSRYAQYRADLATTDPGRTPALHRMALRYREPGYRVPGSPSSS